jgi:hypothetical protein
MLYSCSSHHCHTPGSPGYSGVCAHGNISRRIEGSKAAGITTLVCHSSFSLSLTFLSLFQLELAVSRYPTEERVWDAYEEYLLRDSATGPLRSKVLEQGTLDVATHTKRAIDDLRGRKAGLFAAALSSNTPAVVKPQKR